MRQCTAAVAAANTAEAAAKKEHNKAGKAKREAVAAAEVRAPQWEGKMLKQTAPRHVGAAVCAALVR